MRYIIDKHAKNSQVFTIGFSMGGNILGHVLGNEGMKNSMKIDAAIVF
jgi:predicted alpha/beta-fold hydrolase